MLRMWYPSSTCCLCKASEDARVCGYTWNHQPLSCEPPLPQGELCLCRCAAHAACVWVFEGSFGFAASAEGFNATISVCEKAWRWESLACSSGLKRSKSLSG